MRFLIKMHLTAIILSVSTSMLGVMLMIFVFDEPPNWLDTIVNTSLSAMGILLAITFIATVFFCIYWVWKMSDV